MAASGFRTCEGICNITNLGKLPAQIIYINEAEKNEEEKGVQRPTEFVLISPLAAVAQQVNSCFSIGKLRHIDVYLELSFLISLLNSEVRHRDGTHMR